jgi:ABC-type branched-subunit amino acid transport system substrate-binding protein
MDLVSALVRWTAICVLAMACAQDASAQKSYSPGASDQEIRIGHTVPYSGPLSAYGTYGHTYQAYFKMVNDLGGVRGRKVTFISLDDAYSPPKTVEATRRLVEQDQVLLVFQALGTPTNIAVQKYLNDRRVPQFLVGSGLRRFADPAHFPWTMAGAALYHDEAVIYAKHVLATNPQAKIAVLYQNDDFGKEFLAGLEDGLGDRVRQIVARASYEVTDPTIDSQIVTLHASGADVLMDFSAPKAAAQVIRKVANLRWKPAHYMPSVVASIAAVFQPAGVESAVGVLTAATGKSPSDPRWDTDAAMVDYRAFMKKYYPDGDPLNEYNVAAYNAAFLLVEVLKRCGDALTRENFMRQATSIKGLQRPLSLPGVTVDTSPTDYRITRSVEMRRFDGKTMAPLGDGLLGL